MRPLGIASSPPFSSLPRRSWHLVVLNLISVGTHSLNHLSTVCRVCVSTARNTGANLEPVGTVPVTVTLAPIPLVGQGLHGKITVLYPKWSNLQGSLSQSPGKDNSRRYDNPCLYHNGGLGVDGRSLTISFLLFSNHNDVPGRQLSVRIASGGVSQLNRKGFKIHSFIRFLFSQCRTTNQSFICLKHVPRRCTYATSHFLCSISGSGTNVSIFCWFRVDGTKSHGRSALLHVTQRNATQHNAGNATLAGAVERQPALS